MAKKSKPQTKPRQNKILSPEEKKALRKELLSGYEEAVKQNVSICNYSARQLAGLLIAHRAASCYEAPEGKQYQREQDAAMLLKQIF